LINGRIYSQTGRNELEIITFNNDGSDAELQNYRAMMGIENPYVRDNEETVFDAYEVNGPPTYIIIDQEGTVQYRSDGIPNFDIDAMRAKVDELLGL